MVEEKIDMQENNPLILKARPHIPSHIFMSLLENVTDLEYGILKYNNEIVSITIKIQNYTPVCLIIEQKVDGIIKVGKFLYKKVK